MYSSSVSLFHDFTSGLFLQLRSESDDGMMSDQGSGFSLSVDQDDYHFRPSNVFIPAIPGQSS